MLKTQLVFLKALKYSNQLNRINYKTCTSKNNSCDWECSHQSVYYNMNIVLKNRFLRLTFFYLLPNCNIILNRNDPSSLVFRVSVQTHLKYLGMVAKSDHFLNGNANLVWHDSSHHDSMNAWWNATWDNNEIYKRTFMRNASLSSNTR